MSSLKADFDELRARIRQGRELRAGGFEPIFYLVFPPQHILEAKRLTPAWIARLHQDGWNVHTFSITEHLWAVLEQDSLWPLSLAQDCAAPLDWTRTTQALTDSLTAEGGLLQRLKSALAELQGQPQTLLLVTDLEALHPYLRIGAIEGQLQGEFNVPTIFLYPGERTGKSGLKFLGFYPSDGNYRSVHVGG